MESKGTWSLYSILLSSSAKISKCPDCSSFVELNVAKKLDIHNLDNWLQVACFHVQVVYVFMYGLHVMHCKHNYGT